MGSFMVMEAGLSVLLVLPAPVPVHPTHKYCSCAVAVGDVAVIKTVDPGSYQPLSGVTVP